MLIFWCFAGSCGHQCKQTSATIVEEDGTAGGGHCLKNAAETFLIALSAACQAAACFGIELARTLSMLSCCTAGHCCNILLPEEKLWKVNVCTIPVCVISRLLGLRIIAYRVTCTLRELL